jgi:chromosome partitioning protein
MKIIAFANQKGGVGKTTSAMIVGAGLIMLGKRVLLVDLDPQAQCHEGSALRWALSGHSVGTRS